MINSKIPYCIAITLKKSVYLLFISSPTLSWSTLLDVAAKTFVFTRILWIDKRLGYKIFLLLSTTTSLNGMSTSIATYKTVLYWIYSISRAILPKSCCHYHPQSWHPSSRCWRGKQPHKTKTVSTVLLLHPFSLCVLITSNT